MKAGTLKRLRQELSGFLEEFTQPMGRSDPRGWALMSVRGLLLDGGRKSVEPMSAIRPGVRAFDDPALCACDRWLGSSDSEPPVLGAPSSSRLSSEPEIA